MADEKQDEHGEVTLTNWEFVERVPTKEEVRDLLVDLGECYGVEYVDYIDYVQALPQSKKVKRPVPDRPNLMQDVYLDCWTLYMSVAGRIRMLSDIAQIQDWVVEFEPEPFSPTNVPGFLQMDDRLVYREYVTIKKTPPNGEATPILVGRRPGTAWVPAAGGKQAAGSNPYEKVETSARGRAIAAWGIGVLPGSGVASVEEIHGARENRQALDRQQFREQAEVDVRQSHEDVVAEVLTLTERLRQERGIEEEEAHTGTVKYLTERLGAKAAVSEDGVIDWSKVKMGQLVLLRNSLRQALQAIVDARSEI